MPADPWQEASPLDERCDALETWPPGAGSQGVAVRCGEKQGHEGDHAAIIWWSQTTPERGD